MKNFKIFLLKKINLIPGFVIFKNFLIFFNQKCNKPTKINKKEEKCGFFPVFYEEYLVTLILI